MTMIPGYKARAAVGFGALAGGLFCAYLLSPFLPAILGALVLAMTMAPLDARLERATGRPSLSALLCVLVALVAVLLPAILIVTAATRELRELFSQLSARSQADGGLQAQFEHVLMPALDWIAARTGIATDELRAALVDRLTQAGGAILRSTTAVAGALTESIVQIVVGVMALFYLLRDGPAIIEQLREASPLSREQTSQLFDETSAAVVANIHGVLAVAVAQGTLAGLGFGLVGLKSPVLWGVVTAFFSTIPLIGTAAVWVPAVASMALNGDWTRALLLAGWSAGLVAMADNVVRPWVIGQRTKASPLLVFFALLGGARLFGLEGLFIGPVALSVTTVLIRFWTATAAAAPAEAAAAAAGPETT